MGGDPGRGSPAPVGTTVVDGGVNFSIYASRAVSVELCFFDQVDSARPSRRIVLDPEENRTHHYWHVYVPDVSDGQLFGWRIDGDSNHRNQQRFDREKLLLDPYARGVAVGTGYDREAARQPGDNAATAMKSIVVDLDGYDWEGDRPLNRPWSETIVYEMHVAGFTRHPSSGLPADRRGTYAGLIEKIPYLQELGITAVELLPVYQFDEQDCPPGLINYWGYAPVSFFAPHSGYAMGRDPHGVIDEFRDMVKALHRAGIEVILDVVYNHTAEGDHTGPTFGFRGIDNATYYLLEGGRYHNYSGTGNSINGNHSVVRRLIRDSLRYWVTEMHVDGFRFDLASALTRGENGEPLKQPPVLWDLESDPILSSTKLIAEPWDAAGLYQVGTFIGERWSEWNGKFRDDVRSFVRGDDGALRRLPPRLLGSPDLYAQDCLRPEQSVNFATCHDGFTLNDLVSYNRKHNEANGESNGDGENHNISWNCGVEGPTDDPEIEALRERQIRNFYCLTLLSVGAPMILMGDEVRRTQNGNNNAYCQDNEISWFDWNLVERNSGLLRFVRLLCQGRLARSDAFKLRPATLDELVTQAYIQWHGTRLEEQNWLSQDRAIAVTVRGPGDPLMLHLMMNVWKDPLPFELPPTPTDASTGWLRLIDTARPSPEDFVPLAEASEVSGETYEVEAHSIIMLVAQCRK